jgi:hypothetical protein
LPRQPLAAFAGRGSRLLARLKRTRGRRASEKG